jgi:hypothetical protein
MAEILVSDLCECRPPLLIGGLFHAGCHGALRPRWTIATEDCAARAGFVFSVCKKQGKQAISGCGGKSAAPACVAPKVPDFAYVHPGYALSMADIRPFNL